MRVRPHFLALLITVYFVALAILYARATPVFEAADEGPHFLYAHNLLNDRALPEIVSREELARARDPARLWAIESHQPPLYYAAGALLIAWSDRDDLADYLRSNPVIFIRGETWGNPNKWLHPPDPPPGDTGSAVAVLRGFSIALGVVTLWCVYLTARHVFMGPGLPLLTMLVVASIPTFIAISASINNDNMVTALYSVGVFVTVRTWRRRRITRRDFALLCAVLAVIPLAKLTGVSLFGVVLVALAAGVRRGIYPRRAALLLALSSLGLAAVVSGWWYVRNWTLYGDPLALGATRSLWGREFEIAATSGDPLAEIQRIAQSFWMMVGHLHQPVYGPDWFYGFAALLVGGAVIGLILGWRRLDRTAFGHAREILALLAWVCALVIVMLLAGTRSVDISYGRLLFPALIGFAPLLVFGWSQIVGRRLLPLVVVPLVVMAVIAPVIIRAAYAPLVRVDGPPSRAVPVELRAESLRLVAYELTAETVAPGDTLRLDLYFQGGHPENPALRLTAVDSVTQARLGRAEFYPGMAPIDTLEPQQIYRASLAIPLDETGSDPLSPRRVDLQFAWTVPDTGRDLDGDMQDRLLPGPVLVDGRYTPGAPQVQTDVRFGPAIVLRGFDLPADASPGDDLTLTLYWRAAESIDGDWITAVQLLDASGAILDQADGEPPGYPTGRWVPRADFADSRRLTIPADAAPGTYRVLIGWYRLEDMIRLPATGQGAIQDDLLTLSQAIQVK